MAKPPSNRKLYTEDYTIPQEHVDDISEFFEVIDQFTIDVNNSLSKRLNLRENFDSITMNIEGVTAALINNGNLRFTNSLRSRPRHVYVTIEDGDTFTSVNPVWTIDDEDNILITNLGTTLTTTVMLRIDVLGT